MIPYLKALTAPYHFLHFTVWERR